MKEEVLRGGVIGFGKMGMLHSAIINVLDNSTLCAISEPTSLVRNTFKAVAPHIQIYKDYKKMLDDENLDFVFITTPTSLHIPIAMDCAERGCHFFVEKPIATSEAESRPLVQKLDGSPVMNMVGYMMRYLDTFRFAKQILDQDLLGKLISFNATMYVSQLFKAGKGWRYDRNASGGGVIVTQASHVLDLLGWYFGMPRAVNARILSPYSQTVEDFGHLILDWENGLNGWVDSTWSIDNHRLLETTITIHAENGTMIVDDDFVRFFLREQNQGVLQGWTVKSKTELFEGVALDIGAPQFTIQDADFLKSIREGKPLESDVNNAVRIQRIVDCIYQSAQNDGQTVII